MSEITAQESFDQSAKTIVNLKANDLELGIEGDKENLFMQQSPERCSEKDSAKQNQTESGISLATFSALQESLGAQVCPTQIHQDSETLLDEEKGSLRKQSQADSEFNTEEMSNEEEVDIRRKINQKLIRKQVFIVYDFYSKNYFVDFMGRQLVPDTQGMSNQNQSQMLQMLDKRSRSETPKKMSATEVLYRAHQKLAQSRRKESPHKILEKHQMRQKKAEELRSQIEKSKKNWYEKIRIRQQIAKERWNELLAERKAKLQDKLEQAEERRESEIQTLKNKAKQEIQKIDETNYIVKMTMNNMKMDLNMKMNETQERRNQFMEEQIKKKLHDRAMKEEAAEKRRQELQKLTENKFLTNQQKREMADLRRHKMIENKKRAAQEDKKRSMVLQRKNDLGDKIIDVMSFVNNSECIWEFLGNERDWQDLGAFSNNHNDELIFELIQKDQFEIQKLKLKKDAELLNKMILVDENGYIYANKSYLSLAKRKYAKKTDYFNTNSSDEDNLSVNSQDRNSETLLTPERVRRQIYSPLQRDICQESKHSEEEIKQHYSQVIDDITVGYASDGSDKASIPEESPQYQIEDNYPQTELILTDEAQNYMLSSSRLKMSMKRNILKKTLSEDLTWADFLKNETYTQQYPIMKHNQTRSMCSTPEKKHEAPLESEEAQEDVIDDQSISSQPKGKASGGKGRGSNGKKSIQNQTQNNTSSGSNISEKSRISSVVYPSQKKKKPNNQTLVSKPSQEMKGCGSQNSFKKHTGLNSNQSSTQSLIIANSFSESQNPLVRKSTQLESDSASKRPNARMHSSSVQESSSSHPINHPASQSQHNMSLIDDSASGNEKLAVDTSSSQNLPSTHTGSQMNQLIANHRPQMPQQSKIIPKKLSANAVKMLFPIREQKLLIKRPGKEGQFGRFKLNVKMEDLTVQRAINATNLNSTNLNNANNQSFVNDTSMDEKIPISKTNTSLSQLETVKESSSGKKSNQNTPSQAKRRESIESSGGVNQTKESSMGVEQTTPTQQTSRLLQIQQKFWEKYQNQQIDDKDSSKKVFSTSQQQIQISSEHSVSPPSKRDSRLLQANKSSDQDVTTSNIVQINTESGPLSGSMNEQGYKELIIKILMTDNISVLKTDELQKTIAGECQESEKLIDYLEMNEFSLRYCRLCDLILPEHATNDGHVQMKSHKKTRDELGIKEIEDLSFSIISFMSQPGDIEKELLKEKEKALKRKLKRIKAQMIAQAVSHESASYNPGKEYNSPNKKRLQKICIDLEKQVIPIINNYEALESTLKEILKILDMRKLADLHLMRRLKFIPILIEICKRISVCHKNEFKYLGRMLDYVIKIIDIFCGQRENRNYMLQTNRMLAILELLNWCLNRPTQLFYGINFLPSLLHILTLHVKHRTPYECQQMKEMFIEYLVCSSITVKIKSKFQIINGPLDLSEMMGQVPLFLLKSASFLEAVTGILQIDAIVRPVYEKSTKLGEHILFVIQNTEIFGIIPMISTILLTRNQPFKLSQQQALYANKVLPQTILSLAIISVKILNNILRMDYKAAQQMMTDFEIQEQLYHLFNYLLFYTVETSDKQEDCKELLHETLLLIGYFTLNNEKHQQMLCKGESTLLQKLCNLPFPYFCDKKLKEILFPTLIQATYKSERSLKIMDQELSIDMLVDFIQLNLKEELPKIMEEMDDYHSISSLGGHQGIISAVQHRTRSPSQSSTSSQASIQIDIAAGNSPYLPLYMRFPKKSWKDAITFYSQVLY